jgi:GT2 family glycosyltransferase/glycosyltransferase involved in cell wall biosynthesis
MTPLWQLDLVDPGPEPEVSVIVCAHGHWETTAACIAAIAASQRYNVARAEVILVDDASPDDTAARASEVRGLRLVNLDENVGFLRAATAGADAARGQHLLFLNNDTLPVGAWMDPLVDLLDRRPEAGVVGARLVFEDGSIQEAGGIVFDDGSGWNYGRGFAPDDPRIGFERETDYVSGACLLVRGKTWSELGGFDDRFAPAYYEDTDLAFGARARGWQVWYQPLSIVVHVEGVSHGTSTTSGVKRHQVVNQARFRDKWSDALSRQAAASPGAVPAARWRHSAGHVLVAENEIPTPDRDSGSVRMTELLQAMLRQGFAVTFIPLNGWRRPRYTEQLEALGVEILGDPNQAWDHITDSAGSITHVWLARPHVAEELLAQVRERLPQAVVIYDTVDLHFLRLERAAALTGEPEHWAAAASMREIELRVIAGSDAAVVVSPVEAAILEGLTDTPVAVVPNVHARTRGGAAPGGRSGLLFVGGFQHAPNVDAVAWFVSEVLPRVRATHPDTQLTIAGSNVPAEITQLGGNGVTVTGWVPDLAPLYRKARLSVAPLRFGAGVKGKVGEAMAAGVPVVATTIAAEGFELGDREIAVADDPDEMAAHIVALLEDDNAWQDQSNAARAAIDRRFSPEVVEHGLVAALGLAGTPVTVGGEPWV